MAGSAVLYSREVLALATSLSQWPLAPELPLFGSVRSSTCGSAIDLALRTDAEGRIAEIGVRAQACAIGQASAALFAKAAKGLSLDHVLAALDQLDAWLRGGGGLPTWPGLSAIAAAKDYPARHGAILLPWQAARDALSSAGNPR